MTKEIEGFDYICDVKMVFTYMQKEIDFGIENSLELVTEFYILYKNSKHYVQILNYIPESEKNKLETKTDIWFDKECYSSLEDFKNSAKINNIGIKDLKENVKVVLTVTDSTYLEENQVKQTINKRTFKTSKSFSNTFLFCSIFLTIFAIASRLLFKDQSNVFIEYIFFDSIAILTIYAYIYYKMKKIIYEKGSFLVSGIFFKKKYLLEDIEKVVDGKVPTKGITVYFKDNKKINFSPFLSNYNDVKRILKQNNISIILI